MTIEIVDTAAAGGRFTAQPRSFDLPRVVDLFDVDEGGGFIGYPGLMAYGALPILASDLATSSSAFVAKAQLSTQNEDSLPSTIPASLRANWHRTKGSRLSAGVLNRIRSLASLESGWRGVSSAPLSAGSLRRFFDFWEIVAAYASEPNLTLIPKGRIKALWFKSPARFFDAQFCDDGRIIYGLSNLGAMHEGTGTFAQVVALLEAGNKKVLG